MARLIHRKDFPKGDAAFEANRHGIVQSVLDKIPKELVLPDHYFDNPPNNVTNVPRTCGLLSAEELEITENYDLVALAQAIASKKFTAVQVTSAFSKRACIAHQLTFCLTELYMQEALEQAKLQDEHLARTGKVIGPLHGVPISIKEMVPVKGQICSMGLIVTRNISEQDCDLVAILRRLGAVFYVKTHQPAALFSFEGVDFLGRSLNPHNIDLAPGGSSSGEGALLAMKGSVLGIGTDIGGSIRIPAAFSGVFGLKGSHGFLPSGKLISGPFAGGLHIDGIIGPMGRTLRDIDFINAVTRGARPELLDPEIFPNPYSGLSTPGLSKATLKIGILQDYGSVRPQPPVAQAMAWVTSQLAQAGFNVTPYKFYQPKEASDLYCTLMIPDGWKAVKAGFEAGREPLYPVFEQIIVKMIAIDPSATMRQEETASTIASKKFQRDEFRTRFLADWIAQGDPDIVIAPMSPASPHDTTTTVENNVSQTHLWNLLDYPGLVIPTPFKVESKASYDSKEYEELSDWSDADRETKQLWKDHDYQGAPISLQILAKRRMENELVAAVGLIQDALQLPQQSLE